MKRAAIYARYSSDLQTDRSIDDQVALCTAHAAKSGLAVTAVYDDRARSGASIMGRDGLLAVMDAARDRAFDVLVVEALDRLSRDQEDLAGIYKRLTHVGVEIRAVHDGTADIVQIGIRGLVGALYLQDLAQKVRRGMAGVVRDGRNAGGRAYGYAPVAGRAGELAIVPEEAAIVLRIFSEYVDGRVPRDIAGSLNADGVAPPRGHYWQGSTINGSRRRESGILQNAAYDGRLVWNRTRFVKDPDTGRRISRVNDRAEWQEQAAEHLRIVPRELFAAAAARKRAAGGERRQAPKNGRLLSGLLRCGACGAGMSVKDRMGRQTRIMCTRAKEARACAHTRPYAIEPIEAAVLDALRRNLADRRLLDHYVACYNDEHRRLHSGEGAAREKAAQRLAAARRELARTVDCLIKGVISEAEASAGLPQLRAEVAELEARLSRLPEPPKVVTLKPALISRYIRDLERLEAEVAANEGFVSGEAKRLVRELVTAVRVTPTSAGQPPHVDVEGYLTSLVAGQRAISRGGSMVAEEGVEPPTPGL
ncbi:recombinase family protein [Mesorhizobium sp. KR9-304]|uniref:recombinase family protein n=1 Tax=Mesorhizobium sp. KR9-304 TaxID=3156614 RepID=UPI0032B45D8F